MPRDENAIVGRKKNNQSSGADYVAKKKRVFLYDKHCIYP